MEISDFFDFAVVSEWKQRKTADLSVNPFQLQNASRSALKLRFFDGLGLRWAADPGNSHRGAVLCLRQTRPLRERASAPCDFRFPSR